MNNLLKEAYVSIIFKLLLRKFTHLLLIHSFINSFTKYIFFLCSLVVYIYIHISIVFKHNEVKRTFEK